MLTYQPERFYAAYSQLVVRVQDKSLLAGRMADVSSYIDEQHPGLRHKLKRLDVGPSTAAKLEARFSGADPKVLTTVG